MCAAPFHERLIFGRFAGSPNESSVEAVRFGFRTMPEAVRSRWCEVSTGTGKPKCEKRPIFTNADVGRQGARVSVDKPFALNSKFVQECTSARQSARKTYRVRGHRRAKRFGQIVKSAPAIPLRRLHRDDDRAPLGTFDGHLPNSTRQGGGKVSDRYDRRCVAHVPIMVNAH